MENVYIYKGDITLYKETEQGNIWRVNYDVKPKAEYYDEWISKSGGTEIAPEDRTEFNKGWIVNCKPLFVEVTGVENYRLIVNILGTEL